VDTLPMSGGNDRFGWLSRRDRVCVPMHDPPNAVFGAHDERDRRPMGMAASCSPTLALSQRDWIDGAQSRLQG
jgi:hypothetical protein